MSYATVLGLARETLKVALLLSGPLLVAALVVGLIVSVLQAATQIQEQTIAFVAKLLAAGVVFLVLLTWLLQTGAQFMSEILRSLPSLVS